MGKSVPGAMNGKLGLISDNTVETWCKILILVYLIIFLQKNKEGSV